MRVKNPQKCLQNTKNHSHFLYKGCFCMFGVPLEVFTHLETSLLMTLSFKFWPIFSTHGQYESKGSLACHIYCDKGTSVYMVIYPWHSHLLPSVWLYSCAYNYLFNDLGLSRSRFKQPTLNGLFLFVYFGHLCRSHL